jgi:hypothetical protein
MRRILSLAVLSLVAIGSTASAQRSSRGSTNDGNPPVELGVDAGVAIDLSGDQKTTVFQFPIQRLRAGFFLSPTLSLEPSLGLQSFSVSDGGPHGTVYDIGAGLLWHFSPDRTMNQLYLRPFIDLVGSSGSGDDSDSAFSFGGGFGVKIPVANRFATRLEGYLSHTGEHDGIDSNNQLGLLFGLSVYTH